MAYVALDTLLHVNYTGSGLVRPGRVENANLEGEQSYNHLTGIGGEDSGAYSGIAPKGSGSMWLQNVSLLGMCQKTVVNGLPPTITELQGGVIGDVLKKQTTCFIDTWDLSAELDGALKLDLSWLALVHTAGDITTASAALAKNLMLLWHTAAVTLAGSAWKCQSVKISGQNNLGHAYSLDAKASGSERLPDSIKPGNAAISVELEVNTGVTLDLHKTSPGTVQLVLSAKNSATTVGTFLATLSNIVPVGLPVQVAAGDDLVTWRFAGELDYNDLTSFTFGLV